jgi:transcriptional regulator with XRE-family HTH domain
MDPITETMGDRIRNLRNAKGWSQLELADKLGVTKAAVSHWENSESQNVKLTTFLMLCDVLGARPHYVVFGSPRDGAGRPPSSGKGAQSEN